jgi:anti-sigma B factor antagonist
MKINSQQYDNVMVLELQGELDSDFISQYKSKIEHVIQEGFNRIVLDMSKVTFVDSEGLETLLWTRDYCGENKCQLRLAAISENCAKVLEITRLGNEFDHYEELPDALKSFV